MKKIFRNGSVIPFMMATMRVVFTISANIKCWYIFHQEEKPDSLNKYRKLENG